MKALDAGDARAAVVVAVLREIYAVEAQAHADGVDRDELGRRQQRDIRPLIERLHRMISDLAGRATRKSPLGKAVAYAINQWLTLVIFSTLRTSRGPTLTSSASSAVRPSVAQFLVRRLRRRGAPLRDPAHPDRRL